MCMPNHGWSRIKAVALHAWHNQDTLHQPVQLPMTIRSRTRPSGVFPSLFSQTSNPSRRINMQRGSMRHRPYGSPSPQQFSSANSSVGPRQFTLAFIPYAVTFCVFFSESCSYDIHSRAQNVDDADTPDLRIFRDTIHNFFQRLEMHNLLRTITLQSTNIREQLHTHICNLMADN